MLSLKEFANTIEDRVRTEVSSLSGIQVGQKEYDKPTGHILGLTIENADVPGMTMSFNLTDAYSRFIISDNEQDYILDMVDQIKYGVIQNYDSFSKRCEEAKKLTDYNWVKDHLSVRLVQNTSPYADKAPSIKVGADLIMFAMIKISENESTVVTDNMVKAYGITPFKVLDDALKNAPILNPVVIDDLSKFAGMPGEAPFPVLVVTAQDHVLGASALLYPGVLDELAERLDGNFYIIPSSVHEVMVMPEKYADPENLNDMIFTTNQDMLEPDQILSSHCYFYDAKEKVIVNPIDSNGPNITEYNFDYDDIDEGPDEDIDDDIEL